MTFDEAWQRKEQAQRDLQAALEHGGYSDSVDQIHSARLAYIDAAHDAMQAGLELIARR